MPHFTLQLTPAGPIVDAFVGVSQARAAAMLQVQQVVPPVKQIRALIDTGASNTCIDPAVLAELGLTPTGTVAVTTPTTGATPVECNQYDVALVIPAPNGPAFMVGTIAVTENEFLNAQGFHGLIGRDVLSRCLFGYNGAMGLFTLAY